MLVEQIHCLKNVDVKVTLIPALYWVRHFILFALQIMKRSVQLHKVAHYLVEQCSLFSWLSSILSTHSRKLLGEENKFFLTELTVVVEVVTSSTLFYSMLTVSYVLINLFIFCYFCFYFQMFFLVLYLYLFLK